MQDILFYATANETLATVRDYANAKTVAAPTLTKAVSVRLRLRLFADLNELDPVPIETFANIAAWAFVMDDDFDDVTALKIVADNDQIGVISGTETTTDPDTGETTTQDYTEFLIPISNMNSEALAAWLGTSESKGSLIGELTGYDGDGNSVFVLQIKDFTVRNRLYGSGEPSENVDEYLTLSEARALFAEDLTTTDVDSMIRIQGAPYAYNKCNGTYKYYPKVRHPWNTSTILENVFVNENKKSYIQYMNGSWCVRCTYLDSLATETPYILPWVQTDSNIFPPTSKLFRVYDSPNGPTQSDVILQFFPRVTILKRSY